MNKQHSLFLLLLLLLILHASVVNADYWSISQDDMNKCKSDIGGETNYNKLMAYFNSSGVTINHGGNGGGDVNTKISTLVNFWETGSYQDGVFTCASLEKINPSLASTSCPTRTAEGACVPMEIVSPLSYISCSCNGICLTASLLQSSNKYHNYKPPNNAFLSNSWATCVCHPDYYGERCQYKKGPDDIKKLTQGEINIKDFPYLPWYTTPLERYLWLSMKETTMNYDATYTPKSESRTSAAVAGSPPLPTLDIQNMWSVARTQVARKNDYASTIWSWPGSAHSCPYGMKISDPLWGYDLQVYSYLDYTPNPPFTTLGGRYVYFNDIPSSFGSVNDAYMYYFIKSLQRQHFTCMCDPSQGSNGCSGGGGECISVANGQDTNLKYQFNSGSGFTTSATFSIDDTSLFPPFADFPRPFWRAGLGNPQLLPFTGSLWDNAILTPSAWSICECYPDFAGIYCEIDNRNQAVCDGKGTYKDTLTASNANRWDDPGDCTCEGGTRHIWDTGTPPAPNDKYGTNQEPNLLKGYVRPNFFYRRSTDRFTPTRRRNVCLEDKDVTVCNNKGIYNSVYKTIIDPTIGASVQTTIGCECFLFKNLANGTVYDRTLVKNANIEMLNSNAALRENIAGGVYCETSCRKSKCNNNGICRFQSRTSYVQSLISQGYTLGFDWDVLGKKQNLTSTTGYLPTQDTTPKTDYNPTTMGFADIVVSDTCDCDDGWDGPQCQHNVASGSNCNGFAKFGVNTASLLSCKDACDPNRSFYNDTLARCIGLCPKMTSLDILDPLTTDTSGIGQECGGPSRGTCSGFDGISKTCECKPGFTNPEQGCNLSVCPRVRGQMCNGKGTCELQGLVTSPSIGRGVYRCKCDIGWKGDACEIPDRVGDDKCNSNTQQAYNRESLDWPVV